MINHNIEPSYFLKYVHDINLKPIEKNLALKKEMKKFKGKKIIFTNGTTQHATNVLKRVGVFEEIDNIFDIKDAEYIPKPEELPYKKVVKKFKINPHNAIMIDDITNNLVTAKKLGLGTVLVSKRQSPLKNNLIDYSFKDITSIIKKINNKDIFNEN
jgi:putative hydrolase of the HAD superfamily